LVSEDLLRFRHRGRLSAHAEMEGKTLFLRFNTGPSGRGAPAAAGLALDNLSFVVDWNDYGIDDHPVSTVVHGTPHDWFVPHGWREFGAEFGSEWGPLTRCS